MSGSVPAARRNIHATAVVIGDEGILVRGPSGSGKTATALALLAAAKTGTHAAFVADDRVFVAMRAGRLVAAAPSRIEGLAEQRGLGIVPVAAAACAVIDLVADLVPADAVERMPEPATAELEGVTLPLMRLPERRPQEAAALLQAALAALRAKRQRL